MSCRLHYLAREMTMWEQNSVQFREMLSKLNETQPQKKPKLA